MHPLRNIMPLLLLLLLPFVTGAAEEPPTYPQCIYASGIPIRAEEGVPAEAMEIAARKLQMMLCYLPVVAENLRMEGAQVRIVHMCEGFRATGGLISFNTAENILKLPGDSHRDHRDITVHESAHMLHLVGFSDNLHEAIIARYEQAKAEGLWPGCYCLNNDHEFFAELSMWYFGSRGDYGDIDPPPSEGAQWFKQYDPQSYALLDSIYKGCFCFEPIGRVVLARQPVNLEGEIMSLDTDQMVNIILENQSTIAVELYWLDYEGQRKSMGGLAPGERRSMSTYPTHAWLAVAETGEELGIWVAGTERCRLVVE